ncbi:MAG: hypothetical protein AABZ39_09750 [Spirochaetota bacterium]
MSQSIEIVDTGKGRAQMRSIKSIAVKKGKIYSITTIVSGSGIPFIANLIQNGGAYTRYVEQKSIALPEWAERNTWSEAKNDDASARIVFMFPQKGTVSIKKLVVSEHDSPPVIKKQIKEGNLLPNGNFTLDRYGWTTFGEVEHPPLGPVNETQLRYSVDPPRCTVVAIDEVPVLTMACEPHTVSVLASAMLPVTPEQPFVLHARVRMNEGSSSASLGIFCPGWYGPKTKITIDTNWTSIEVRGTVPERSSIMYARAELRASGAGSILVSGVSLVQRAGNDGKAAFGVIADRTMTLYTKGTEVQLRYFAAHAAGKRADWSLVTIDNKEIRRGSWSADTPGTETFTDLDVGWYQLRWETPWSTTTPKGMMSIGIVPDTKRIAGRDSPFGIHIEGGDIGVAKMRLLGVHWIRANNPLFTKWTAVEPQKGKWFFPDVHVDRFLNAGFDILGSLDRTPQWAAQNPSNVRRGTDFLDYKADLPADMSAWQNYVRTMVQRYRTKIRYWDIWNEPDIDFLNPPSGMTRLEAWLLLVKSAKDVIKSIDPDIKIVGGPAYFFHTRGLTNNYMDDFPEKLVENLGIVSLDVFGFHHYVRDRRFLDDSDHPLKRLEWMRSAMKIGGKTPVIWNTEWGFASRAITANGVYLPDGVLSPMDAAGDFVYWSVMQLALGIEKIFFYDGQDDFYYHHHYTKSFWDYREPRPIAVACAVLTKMLDGLHFTQELPASDGRILQFSGASRTVLVAWSRRGRDLIYDVPSGSSVVDCLGRPLPQKNGKVHIPKEPVYIVKNTDAWE